MKLLRASLYFVVGLLLGTTWALSYAGTFQSYQGSAYRTINGTTYWKGDAGTLAQSQARVIESVNVGGKYIGVPYLSSIGTAAVSTAIAAVRSTPGAFITSALLSYLLSQGIEYINGQFVKKGDPVQPTPGHARYQSEVTGVSGPNLSFTVLGCKANGAIPWSDNLSCSSNGFPNGRMCGWCKNPDNSWWVDSIRDTGAPAPTTCPGGYTLNAEGTSCIANDYVPVGDSDWDKVRGVTPPDEVMRDLCEKIAALGTSSPGCPMSNPRVEQTSTPISEYSPDGKRKVVTIKPAPTPEDPYRIEISVEEETKTVTTNPDGSQTETTTKQDTTEKEDFCTLHPDSIACSQWGEPEDADLEKDERNINITPDGGWGADSGQCPADETVTLRNGTVLTQSWQPVCQTATTFRPLIIGMAWVVAALLALGIHRRSE